MKKIKITAAILSLTLLTACKSGQSVQTSETVSETEASIVTTSETTAMPTETESATSAITTTAAETVPETEPAEVAEKKEIEYVQVPQRKSTLPCLAKITAAVCPPRLVQTKTQK